MTKASPISSTAPAGEPAGAPEIEVTPEMVSAGELALLSEIGGSVEVFWSPPDLAISVYRAMRALDRR